MKILNSAMHFLAWLCLLSAFRPVVSSAQSAQTAITANQYAGRLTLNTHDILTVRISLEKAKAPIEADWWILAATSLPAPNDFFHFDGSAWKKGIGAAYRKPLADLPPTPVLSLAGLPPGPYVFYFGVDETPNGVIDTDSLAYAKVEVDMRSFVAATAQSCGSDNDLFSSLPLDEDAFFEIDPLGATNPAGHTFPTVHTYMMLTDSSIARPVYTPGDVTITRVSRSQNLTRGTSDYGLNFSPCPEVNGYFDHLSSLETFILAQLGEFGQCNQYLAGEDEYRYCSQDTAIALSANTLIGTAGGPDGQNSAALDFGLRDTRTAGLFYSDPARLVSGDQLYVVCPYDYYADGAVKTLLFQRLGNAREDFPQCGRIAYDITGTARGRWYLAGTDDFSENGHLALIPANRSGDIGVLSVGNASLDTDAYYFDFLDSGRINRRFSDIDTPDTVYCFDNLRNRADAKNIGNFQPLSGYFYLSLQQNGRLIIERNSRDTLCPADPDTLVFGSNAVEFQR